MNRTTHEIMSGPNVEPMAERLRVVVDGFAATLSNGDNPQSSVVGYAIAMGKLLADRLGDRVLNPEGYAYEVEFLRSDAEEGYSAYTREQMPEIVTGYDSSSFVPWSIDFARQAFGDEFGDTLLALNYGREHLDQVIQDRALMADLRHRTE